MATTNYSYIGKGTIYFKVRGASAGLLPIGNCSALEFSAEEDKKTQLDYTSAGGGLANSVSRISAVTLSLTILDISAPNLALAMRGASSAVTAGTVTGEAHTAYLGALVPFAYQPNLEETITVTVDPSGTPVTAVQDTDYELTRSGIVVLSGATKITDGASIEVDYTKSAAAVMEALVDAGSEFQFVFDGLNEAQSGKAVTVTVHRVKLSPGQNLAFIGDDFAEVQAAGDVLSDNSITGTNISRFFKVAMAD